MSSVEQRARELLAAEYQREGIKGVEPEVFDADRAALRAIAAALREQPEARGVVDDAMDVGAILTRYLPTKYWGLADHLAALAAAQQPGQDGGGEVATARRLAVGLWQRHYREVAPQWEPCSDLAGLLSQIDNMASGLRRFDDTAPPSAPVGADDPAYRAGYAQGVDDSRKHECACTRTEALTQQPAQAAPGDVASRQAWFEAEIASAESHWIDTLQEQFEDGDEVPDMAQFVALWLAERTPPGDDAAGGTK